MAYPCYKKTMYNPQTLAIYIHWPFCKSKCPYCDFYKELYRHQNQSDIIDEYINSLRKYASLTSNRTITSIFFGGGTPSLIEPQNIERIINEIAKLWNVSDNIEISLEANPNTQTPELFSNLKTAGINRLSLGVQSLIDNDLRFLGRTHSADEARQCIKEITRVFSNHSIDLIYALPHQDWLSWQPQLAEICNLGLKHISLYQLTIEEGTIFARRGIKPLNEEKSAELYCQTREYLHSYGYDLYEVSNFAKSGYESRHNLVYWQGGDYLGIGASAHGRLYINGQHIATEYPFKHENISASERAEELILMGLRLTKGINKHEFKQICGLDFSKVVNPAKKQMLQEMKLLEEDEKYVRATANGMLVLNQIISELCC